MRISQVGSHPSGSQRPEEPGSVNRSPYVAINPSSPRSGTRTFLDGELWLRRAGVSALLRADCGYVRHLDDRACVGFRSDDHDLASGRGTSARESIQHLKV